MRIHLLQHVPFEGAGSIAAWAARHNYPLSHTTFFEAGFTLPAMDAFDALVVMGGPMGVYDEAKFPWLAAEKAFIRAAIDAGKRVLGVCLGAQLAADALGAKVTANAQKEIGWFPIHKTGVPNQLLWDMGESQVVMHWHGDTFTLPSGALHLLKSQACENQAFLWRDQVLGLQFHLELSGEDIENLLEACGREVKVPAGFVQDRAAIREGVEPYAEAANLLLDSVLARFLG
jgi:GMP synthase-like glutamine amidotransferase